MSPHWLTVTSTELVTNSPVSSIVCTRSRTYKPGASVGVGEITMSVPTMLINEGTEGEYESVGVTVHPVLVSRVNGVD